MHIKLITGDGKVGTRTLIIINYSFYHFTIASNNST